MPIRVYELARDLNYSLEELEEKKEALGLLSNSPFSLVPAKIEEKIRGKLDKRDPSECLNRTKPKRAKKKAKPKPKKKVVPAADSDEEATTMMGEESTMMLDETASDISSIEDDSVIDATQGETGAEAEGSSAEKTKQEKSSGKGSLKTPQTPHADVAEEDLELGRLKNSQQGDDFEVGRIVSEAPVKPAKPAAQAKKKKRAVVDPADRLAEWSQKYGVIVQQQPLPKKTSNETKGSKLQRMQLVYGHELPKKLRQSTSEGQREAVAKEEALMQVVCPTNIRDLSEKVGVKAPDVIKFLMTQGVFLTITDQVDKDMGETIATEFGLEVEFVDADEALEVKQEPQENTDHFKTRPPVITIMGHVDHGKTSLLDAIRSSNLADGETGGITQHIGGYQVEKDGHILTFLDTPGHAAFTQMRARGANVTDLVVLVVASDDGMMPQTEEAVNHAKAAGVPIIVAINKMDLEDANPNRIKEQLATLELIPEEWSGSTPYIPVSAKTGEGLDDLLEMIHLQSEVLELKADFDRLGEGVVIESHLETGRGVVASVLVQHGKVKKGDPIICGRGFGFLRQMQDENGKQLKEAGPSKIVKVTGLSECPSPGDTLNVMKNIKESKEMAEDRLAAFRERMIMDKSSSSMDNIMDQLSSAEMKNMNILVKGDVQGSIEALEQALKELGNEEVAVKLIHKGIGAVSESDVLLAKASDAMMVAFRVNADAKCRRLAQDEGVEIRNYNVIYDLLDDIQSSLEGMLEPDRIEEIVGEVEVQQVFKISNIGNIAGSFVRSGYVERNMPVRLIRDGIVVYTGKVQALRRFKEDVKRVETRYECGIRLENCEDIKADDIIETFTVREVEKKLS